MFSYLYNFKHHSDLCKFRRITTEYQNGLYQFMLVIIKQWEPSYINDVGLVSEYPMKLRNDNE